MVDISYTDLGFDAFMRRDYNVAPEITEDDAQIKTPQIPQATVSGEVPEAKIKTAVGDLIRITDITQASGTASNNSGIRLTSTLSDKSDRNKVLLGICESAVYQDSVSGSTIIPYGSNAIANNHKVDRGYDLNANQGANNPGHDISFMHHVENQTGTSHTYIFQVRWRYVGNIIQEAVG